MGEGKGLSEMDKLEKCLKQKSLDWNYLDH